MSIEIMILFSRYDPIRGRMLYYLPFFYKHVMPPASLYFTSFFILLLTHDAP